MHKRAEDVEDGFCDMHLGALAGALPLSLIERKVDKKVVNKWPPFLDRHKALKDMCTYLFGKKEKRYPDYVKVLTNANMPVIMVDLPVHTRVAGVLLMFQSAIRSMFGIRYYATRKPAFESKCLSLEEWKQIVQFEAVMRKAFLFCFDTQGDRPEVASESLLAIMELRIKYEYGKEWDVVDIEASPWDPNTKFEDLPRVTMSSSSSVAERKNLP